VQSHKIDTKVDHLCEDRLDYCMTIGRTDNLTITRH